MKEDNKTQQPLYKVLNEQAKNGYKFSYEELKSFVPDGWEFFRVREYGADQTGVKYRRKYEPTEPHYNEDGYEYKEIFYSSKKVASDKLSALSVNNLHHLAEALSLFIEDEKESGWGYNPEHIKKAKAALSRIS